MKPPGVPRSRRRVFLAELARIREADCSWPRRHGLRPPCGRCFACDLEEGERLLHLRGLH